MLIEKNENGLLTYQQNGFKYIFGYLDQLGGIVFESKLGNIEGVTPAEAEKHNAIFDAMNIQAMDNCPLGQGGTHHPNQAHHHHFYLMGKLGSTRGGKGK